MRATRRLVFRTDVVAALTSDLLTSMDQEAERIVRAVTSANVMEAVAAFAAKRKPVFSCYIRRIDP